jgi:phage/plasmid primase-like uncharacterized protein
MKDLRGLWPTIFPLVAPQLNQAMRANGDHVPCPVHGGTDGFRLFPDWRQSGGGICNTCGCFGNGVLLLAWLLGCSTREAFKLSAQAVEGSLGGVIPAGREMEVNSLPEENQAEGIRLAKARIDQILAGVVDITDTPAEVYLRQRGVWTEEEVQDLYFHPELFYARDIVFPGMVGIIRDHAGEVVALHRTFLTQDGKKAPVTAPKKITPACGPCAGSAIRLMAPVDGVFGVAEGIETALAAHRLHRMPVWSLVSASWMGKFIPPAGVERVIIFADADKVGKSAAVALARRLHDRHGLSVKILAPKRGKDYADILAQK